MNLKIRLAVATILMTMLPLCSMAQEELSFRRGNCMPEGEAGGGVAAGQGNAMRRLPSVNKNWDANRVYRQLVILISFSDTDFKEEDPQAFLSVGSVTGVYGSGFDVIKK